MVLVNWLEWAPGTGFHTWREKLVNWLRESEVLSSNMFHYSSWSDIDILTICGETTCVWIPRPSKIIYKSKSLLQIYITEPVIGMLSRKTIINWKSVSVKKKNLSKHKFNGSFSWSLELIINHTKNYIKIKYIGNIIN